MVEAEGGLLAEALTDARDGDERLGALVSSGPRTAEAPEEYALLVEAIREGDLLHYGTGRVVGHPISANAAAAASSVRVTCSPVWASDGNQASNCDGGG